MNRYRELGWEYEPVCPRQAIRINTMNTKESNVVERLWRRGVKLEEVPFVDSGYWVCDPKFSVGVTTEYLLGLYSIQEAAAQIPVSLFTRLKNKTVLDACAAPGGKTVQLANLMHNSGAIIALDIGKRLIALTNHLERCRVKNTIAYLMDARQASRLNLKFDRILLDVPCSGNLTSSLDWFQIRAKEDIERNAAVQREILVEAAKILKDDGEIVYSTCSLEPEEDELNIDWAMKNLNFQTVKINGYGEKGVTSVFGEELDEGVENCRRIWPGQTQGFFVCKLKRECT